MVGSRPFTQEEIKKISDSFKGKYALRNEMLFWLMLYTGFRISEALSLKIEQVRKFDKINDNILVKRQYMKGKKDSRSVSCCDKLKSKLEHYLSEYESLFGVVVEPKQPLFISQKGGALKLAQAEHIFDVVFKELNLENVTSHSCRKTYANTLHKDVYNNDISMTQQALGHREVTSTQHYIAVNNEKVQNGIKSLDFG